MWMDLSLKGTHPADRLDFHHGSNSTTPFQGFGGSQDGVGLEVLIGFTSICRVSQLLLRSTRRACHGLQHQKESLEEEWLDTRKL